MKLAKILLLVGAITVLPACASADRYYGRYPGYSKPYWSGNSRGYGYDNSFGSSRTNSLIQSGIQSGRLSQAEVRELRGKQWNLRQEQRASWADGRLSRSERSNLRDSYQDFYHDLNHELNDGERRNYRGRNFFWR